jgi:hypothetical protein
MEMLGLRHANIVVNSWASLKYRIPGEDGRAQGLNLACI